MTCRLEAEKRQVGNYDLWRDTKNRVGTTAGRNDVDEVQDISTGDCIVLHAFRSLVISFLRATAQNVVEGVDFRFEDICSVGCFLFGRDRRYLIPEIRIVKRELSRSFEHLQHVAASILDRLFSYLSKQC
jgi:hypothetical protein